MSASKLFNRIENLRAFRLTWSVKYHGCGSNWDTGGMLHVLEQAAGDTLEELSIHDIGDTNMTGTVPFTLAGFKRLRVFESDFEFLCGEPFDRAGQPEELCDDVEPGNLYEEGEDKPNTKVAPFVDLLPKTIERIFFNIVSWYQIVEEDPSYLFERMHEERASKLPQLVDISFVIPTVKEHINTAYPATVENMPSMNKETEAKDKLVALITSCGGTVKTQDWWSPGGTWRTA